MANDGQSANNQLRLLNAGHYFPLHDVSLIKELEERNVVFVSELFSAAFRNQIEFNENDSIEGLLRSVAEKYLKTVTIGSFERRVGIIAELAENWSVDGIVHFLPWGCRLIGSSAHAIAEHMRSKYNIPSLIIDADPLDRGIYSKGAVRTRMDAFIEILEQKKK